MKNNFSTFRIIYRKCKESRKRFLELSLNDSWKVTGQASKRLNKLLSYFVVHFVNTQHCLLSIYNLVAKLMIKRVETIIKTFKIKYHEAKVYLPYPAWATFFTPTSRWRTFTGTATLLKPEERWA